MSLINYVNNTSPLGEPSHNKGKFHFMYSNEWYIVSNNSSQVLIFPSNKDKDIVSFMEVIDTWAFEASELYDDLYEKHT